MAETLGARRMRARRSVINAAAVKKKASSQDQSDTEGNFPGPGIFF